MFCTIKIIKQLNLNKLNDKQLKLIDEYKKKDLIVYKNTFSTAILCMILSFSSNDNIIQLIYSIMSFLSICFYGCSYSRLKKQLYSKLILI